MTNESQTIGEEKKTNYKIGKIINANDFKVDCKGCKSKFNNFVRFSLPTDSMKWDCQNCSSEFSMYAQDFEENENTTSVKIAVFHKRRGITTHKEYGLINNRDFRELTESQQPKGGLTQ